MRLHAKLSFNQYVPALASFLIQVTKKISAKVFDLYNVFGKELVKFISHIPVQSFGVIHIR